LRINAALTRNQLKPKTLPRRHPTAGIDRRSHLMDARPHSQRTMVDRDAALAAFVALNVKYDG
jgi:hypothetical protein